MRTLYFNIADFKIAITFKEEHNSIALIPSFTPFLIEKPSPNETILCSIMIDDAYRPASKGEEIGQFDCGGAKHGVYRNEGAGYQFMISDVDESYCSFTETNADFTRCTIALIGKKTAQRSYGLSNALMMIVSFATSTHQTLLMHASVVKNRGKGVLCLGKSGTGKSTHTGLWLKHIAETELINDDNPIVRIIDNKAYVYGTPWSGKTPCYRNIVSPIGVFIRIEQAPDNQLIRQTIVESFASLLPTCSTMKWDKRIYDGVCDTITLLVATIPCYLLKCRPDKEAVLLSSALVV